MGQTNAEPIYIDYSIFSTYQTCREKARLSYVESFRPLVTAPPLEFGSAWHAGIAALYVNRDLEAAKAAFRQELKDRGSALPLNMDADEKRSVERGLYLLEAYAERWRDEPFEILRTPEGKPYIEVQFSVFLTMWRDRPVLYTGVIDRIMKSRITGRPVNVETKTTSQGLTQFMKQIKPNHQVTGYHLATTRLGIDTQGTVWDATFISNRKPDSRKGGWMTYGIDFEGDFARIETRRSEVDLEEFIFDLTVVALEYCEWRYGDRASFARWPRNAPSACHQYGGCQFRDVCSSNLNPDLIRSSFKVEPWEPWNRFAIKEATNA